MTNRQKSFPRRLSSNIVLITSILFIIATAVAAASSHILISKEATKSAEHLRDASILKIEKTLLGVESSVYDALWLVNENQIDEEYLYHITYKLVEENPNIIGSAIAFVPNYFPDKYYFSPYSWFDEESGAIKQRQLGNPNYDYFYMDWFQIPYIKGEATWSEPYFDEGGADCLMSTYSCPIRNQEGDIIAIITADISLQWIATIIGDIHPYESSAVALVSRCGKYINFDDDFRFKGETLFSAEEYYDNHDVGLHEVALEVIANKKEMMKFSHGTQVAFVVFGPISNGWRMLITCEYKEVLAGAATMQIVLIILCIIGVIVLFIISYLMIWRMTRPLVDLSSSAISIAEGNFNTSLPEVKFDDEVMKLRNSFEYMQHSLTKYIQDLETATAEKQRIESELNIASDIQRSMLPAVLPDNDKVRVNAFLKPAKEVGGDLYDIVMDSDRMYFMVGDVSGKGVPASLYMALTISAFRFISGLGLTLGQMAGKINNTFCESNATDSFVTLFFGVIHFDTGEMYYCNCGHNPMVIISPDGKPSFIPAKPNLAVGVFPDYEYHAEMITLKHGSKVLLYTDGVTEAEDSEKNLYGENRLLSICDSNVTCDKIHDDLKSFTGDNPQNDDITIVTIDYRQ